MKIHGITWHPGCHCQRCQEIVLIDLWVCGVASGYDSRRENRLEPQRMCLHAKIPSVPVNIQPADRFQIYKVYEREYLMFPLIS